MNQLCYRIIRNAKGQVMAVAEIARSLKDGGQAGCNQVGRPKAEGLCMSDWHQLSAMAIALAALANPAVAQVIADSKAAATERPVVLRDASGAILVNIQTPSAAGVSRNVYSQFDVQSRGVMLNNLRGSNPYIVTPAKVILNEVNSSAQSQLAGQILVRGPAADVVIANPSGVNILGGAGFWNVGRAIVTTGTPVMESGQFTGLDIRQGRVTIGSGGLSAVGAASLEIYARGVTTEGRILGREISVVTGTQHLDMASGRLTSIAAGADTKPLFAIDTAQLGGMYANRITLLATEDSTGVRNRGLLQAYGDGGQLVITADGLLENQGQMNGTVVSLATVQSDIASSGRTQASKFLTMSSGRDITIAGRGTVQVSGSDVLISAARNIELKTDAELSSSATGGRLSLTAGGMIKFDGRNTVGASGEVQLAADGSIGLTSATLSSGISVVALAGGGITSVESYISGPRVHLETGAAFSSAAADLSVNGGKVAGNNQTTLISSGNLSISGQDPLLAVRSVPGCQMTACAGGGATPVASSASTAVVRGDSDVHLQARRNLTIAAGSNVEAGRDLTVMSEEALKLLSVPGTTASNGQVARLTAVRDLQLTGGSVSQVGSALSGGGAVSIVATNGAVELTALSNANGASSTRVQIDAAKDINVAAYQGSLNVVGLAATGQNIHLVSNGITSIGAVMNTAANKKEVISSSLTAREDITVGSIGVGNQVSVGSTDLKAGGIVRVSGKGAVFLGATLDETRAANIDGSGIAVQGASVQTGAARLQATSGNIQMVADAGAMTLGSQAGMGTLLNAIGNIALHGNAGLTAIGAVASAGGSFSSTSAAGEINAQQVRARANDIVSFASKGGQSHTGNMLTGGALSIYNEDGLLKLTDTRLRATATVGAESAALSGKVSVESGADLLIDAKTVLDATTDLSVIRGRGDMVINPLGMTRGTLTQDQLKSGRDLTLATRDGNFVLSGATGGNGLGSSARVSLAVAGSLNIFGNSVTLQGTQISGGGTVGITATKGDLQVDANLVTNVGGLGAANSQWDQTSVNGGRVNLQAAGNIGLNAVKIASPGTVSVLSGGNTIVAGEHATVSTVTPINNGDITRENHLLVRSSIIGDKGVSIGAPGGSLVLNATDVSASLGTLKLQALGSITLEAAMNHWMSNTFTSIKKCTWYGKCKKTVTNVHDESLLADPVTLFGQSIELKAGGSVNTYAGHLKSSGNLLIEAGDEALYYAVMDQTDYSVSVSKKSSLWGVKFNSSNTSNSRSTLSGQVTQLQSKGNIVSLSGGNTLLQGTTAEYGGTATFQVGVGEKARADAQLILEGVKNRVTQTRTQDSNYVVWQSMVNQGSVVETLRMPTFTGPSNPIFIGPVLAQLPAGDFKTQIQTLAKQPGMGYLNDLTTRKDVKWQEVKLAFDQWNYRQEGLTPAGAALISVAVAWATNGLGAGLLDAVGLGGSATAGLAADAAFISLASQASITLVNNKGNIGKTLKDLASSATLRATLSAALTAGVMEQIGALPALKSLKTGTEFTDKLTLNLIDASGRALIDTGINGGNLQEALKSAILSAAIDTAHAAAASQIKVLEADYLAHKIAHALVGCAAGAATNANCQAGAIGAAVGEIVTSLIPPANGVFYTDAEKPRVLALGKIAAGGAAALAGRDAATAITTAETAISNNAFFIPIIYLLSAAAGYTTGVGAGNPIEGLKIIGQGNDPLSKGMTAVTLEAVRLAADEFPDQTRATLLFLSAAGGKIDATVSYVDEKTGRIASSSWNSLSQDTRDKLVGSSKVVLFLTPSAVGQLKQILTKAPEIGAATSIFNKVELTTPSGVLVASAIGEAAPMRIVRLVGKGEKLEDLVNNLKVLTWETGDEHAVVTLANGQRALVAGGPGGIQFAEGSISRIFGHTHPTNALPSAADAEALRQLGNAKQYVFHGGEVTVVRPSH